MRYAHSGAPRAVQAGWAINQEKGDENRCFNE